MKHLPEIRLAGFRACMNGEPLRSNPYLRDRVVDIGDYWLWRSGWLDANDQDLLRY
jgi:hypothetical protein